MPKRRRRSFTPQFKAQIVIEVPSGKRIASEAALLHKLKPELISRWKDIDLEGLEGLLEGQDRRSRDQDRIAELEADGRALDDRAGPQGQGPGMPEVDDRQPLRTVGWGGSWTTCTTGSGSIRLWAA